ncbi:chromate transporter, chromate ion transporter family [Desulfosporosinus acidiphilus SJ4]|uniref:Chromate transporter, chromate ion transporter family n=1 Tax=Desulfosporosinus acidiphilus (strain DSM 22704 / JCM 16185 / SJ4) TaxID=646529 RepID=I4D1F8_DESAJ|nr:chromate efflux transporter [Desulfosporosinus acidiphilus]AFM39632.1 chromate transporter, chromate ion transporter family [Desulfosporosinus acidiphilus SJ4]
MTAFSQSQKKQISLQEIFWAFFKMGLTAFGPTMAAEAKKNIVKRKQWLNEQEFLNGLALAQFIPGATFVTLTIFMGYRLRRLAGAVASFTGFLLPPTALMILLSYLYFSYSNLPLVAIAFRGLEAIVVALIVNAIVDLGRSAIKDWQTLFVAVVSLTIACFNQNVFLIILLAAFLSIIVFSPWKREPSVKRAEIAEGVFHWREIAIVLAVAIGIVGISALYPVLLQLENAFFWIGFLVFGNGFTMIPMIQQQVVNVHHWLNLDQFTAGIALGQITPGPILITATFIGYKVAGVLGAIVATLAIFYHCFVMIIPVMPIYAKIKDNPWVKAIFKGLVASFVGLMVVVAIGMGRNSLTDYTTTVLSVAALAVLRLTKIDVLWVVFGGTSIFLLLAKVFGL